MNKTDDLGWLLNLLLSKATSGDKRMNICPKAIRRAHRQLADERVAAATAAAKLAKLQPPEPDPPHPLLLERQGARQLETFSDGTGRGAQRGRRLTGAGRSVNGKTRLEGLPAVHVTAQPRVHAPPRCGQRIGVGGMQCGGDSEIVGVAPTRLRCRRCGHVGIGRDPVGA